MAEVVQGMDRILKFRRKSKQSTAAAARMLFQTQHEKSSSIDSESTVTKDGTINSLSDEVVGFSLTCLMAQKDEARNDIEAAYHSKELIELWDIDVTAPIPQGDTDAGKYPCTYYQGYITEWSESCPTDSAVEISISIAINGAGVRGNVPVDDAEIEAVRQYAFATTEATGA